MIRYRLLKAFWQIRGKSITHTIRLYVWIVFFMVEGVAIRLLPKNLRSIASKKRLERLFRQSESEKVYIYRLRGYYSMFLYLTWGQVEEFSLEWFQWREGEIGMQIGANRGEYSIMAAQVIGAGGLCIAVEPNPKAYLDLLELIALNKAANIMALLIACGSAEGKVALELPPVEWSDEIVRVKTSGSAGGQVIAQARLCRVDGIVQGLGLERCDFMIIDVEGYEGEVLRGADVVLRQFRPRLYIEIHDTWDEIEGLLREYGYGIRAWKGNRPGRGHIWAMPQVLE